VIFLFWFDCFFFGFWWIFFDVVGLGGIEGWGGWDQKMSKDKVPWKLHMKKLERNQYFVWGQFFFQGFEPKAT